MKKPKQLHFFNEHPSFADENRKEHGGSTSKNRRKLYRPISTKTPLHVVLKSSRAKNEYSLLRQTNAGRIRSITHKFARKFHVRIYEYANAGNHIHLLIQGKTREGIQNFLRTISALIARAVLKAKKSAPKGKFWDALAYSRIVTWGKELVSIRRYFSRNRLEAIGFFSKGLRAYSFGCALDIANKRSILQAGDRSPQVQRP